MKKILKKILPKKVWSSLRKTKAFFLYKKKNKFIIPRKAFSDIKMLCDLINLKDPVFIDGGANNGTTIVKINNMFPKSKIIAFEPVPEVAKSIKFKDNNLVKIFTKALGNKDEKITFLVNKNSFTSSFLEPGLIKRYNPGLGDLVKKIQVDCMKIDSLVEKKIIPQPDIIKLDLQGYELEAIRGAKNTLPNVKIIYSEIEFVKYYKNQALFHDISTFLEKNNFSLFNFYGLYTHDDGQLIAGDAIFINNNFYDKNKINNN